MNQGIAHQMQADLLGQGLCLFNNFSEELKAHQFFCTYHLRAKATLKVADIADFNIDLEKPFFTSHSLWPFRIC
jgi:hypothetical protein